MNSSLWHLSRKRGLPAIRPEKVPLFQGKFGEFEPSIADSENGLKSKTCSTKQR
jgi:hypothetical protein